MPPAVNGWGFSSTNMQIIASAMGSFGHLAFFGQPAKCEAAHTSPPIIPYKNPATWNQEGTHGTKTSYRRDCSCNGGDHPNGHDVGRVADLPASTFAFVLGRSTSFLPPTLDARRRVAAAGAGGSPLGGGSNTRGTENEDCSRAVLVSDRLWLARDTDGNRRRQSSRLGLYAQQSRLQASRR